MEADKTLYFYYLFQKTARVSTVEQRCPLGGLNRPAFWGTTVINASNSTVPHRHLQRAHKADLKVQQKTEGRDKTISSLSAL